MKLSHFGIAAVALFGFGLTAGPVAAQPHRPGPGMHRPPPRPHVRPHHRKKRICRTVYRHGHRERQCHYR